MNNEATHLRLSILVLSNKMLLQGLINAIQSAENFILRPSEHSREMALSCAEVFVDLCSCTDKILKTLEIVREDATTS